MLNGDRYQGTIIKGRRMELQQSGFGNLNRDVKVMKDGEKVTHAGKPWKGILGRENKKMQRPLKIWMYPAHSYLRKS